MRILSFLAAAAFLVLASGANAQPTYARDVSRIIQAKCQMCHRPNDIAPMALLNYDDASTWADDIKRVITDKIMPPWKPVSGYGDFKDAYSLSDEERRTITDWVDAGAPMGDPADLPEARPVTGDWQLGDPDMLFQMKESYTPPRGKDVYRCFVVSNPFDQAAYVKAVDVLPGNRKIVHHVIMFIDEQGTSDKLDAAEDGPGYTCFGGPGFDISINSMLGGWAPGSIPKPLPDGIGIQVPKGAKLVMQVHYFPSAFTGEDSTRVGLYLTPGPIEKRLFYIPVVDTTFAIPPGESAFQVKVQYPIPPFLDAKLVQIFPHMHLLGKQIKVEVTQPRTDTQPLIWIDNWEFNWQGFYNYKEQIPLPAFSVLKLTCTFDNSSGNPSNPNDPLTVVRWGEKTTDEMCLAFMGVTFDHENLLPFRITNAPKSH